jgi:hypothetical protein
MSDKARCGFQDGRVIAALSLSAAASPALLHNCAPQLKHNVLTSTDDRYSEDRETCPQLSCTYR